MPIIVRKRCRSTRSVPFGPWKFKNWWYTSQRGVGPCHFRKNYLQIMVVQRAMCKTADREWYSYTIYCIRTAVKKGQMISETTPKAVTSTSKLSRFIVCHYSTRGKSLTVLGISALTHCSVPGHFGVWRQTARHCKSGSGYAYSSITVKNLKLSNTVRHTYPSTISLLSIPIRTP